MINKFSFSFIILRSEEGLTSFNKYNHVNFSDEKKCKMKLYGVSIFENTGKKALSQILPSWSSSSSNL